MTVDITWFDRGACRGVGHLFFSDAPTDITRAKAICHDCPVQPECHQFAVDHHEPGVWGGLTEDERAATLPRRRPVHVGFQANPREHGSNRGYAQHRRHNENACQACREAHSATVGERRDRARRTGNNRAKKRTAA